MWEKYIEQLPNLSEGSHKEGSGSLCAMEMVAFMERLPHSDAPPCTCTVLASYTRSLNDSMDETSRQMLLPILPMLVGTVNKDLVATRAKFFSDAARDRFLPLKGPEVWAEAVAVLVEAIELDTERVVAQWQPETVKSLIKEFS